MSESTSKEMQEIMVQQKIRLNENIKTYNRNIKAIGLRAMRDRERYNIPYTEIGALAGMSGDTVSEFLRGKTVPHIVAVMAICGAINLLKPQYALQTVTKATNKSKGKNA
jgi:transcriptional regulator with XRE-family HTH domain